MSFLRRILGGGRPGGDAPDTAPADPAAIQAAEAERDRQLLLDEAHRLDDDLIQRQLRYAARAWTPPPQGGSRRADDTALERDEDQG